MIFKLFAWTLETGGRNLLKWLRTWLLELWTIPAAVLVFMLSVPVLRWLDPSSGTYDAGILQKILWAIIALLVCNGVAWAGMRMVWKEMFTHFQEGFKTKFDSLTTIQKTWLGLFVFSLYFLAFVVFTLAV